MKKSTVQSLCSMSAKSLILFVFMSVAMASPSHAQSTWKILPNAPALTSGRYEDIYFVSEKTGWAVRANIIIRTSDGGESWEAQEIDGLQGGFRSVAFLDSLRGWAGTLGGDLLQTTDGGMNWQHIRNSISPLPQGVCDLSVVGDSVVVGSGRWSGPTNFITSTNSGARWNNKSLSDYASLLIGCKFFSSTSGFIVGASSTPDEGGVVLHTLDGGATWEYRHKTMRSQEHIWNIIFITPEVGYATVQNPFRLDTLAVIKTADGGLTWERKIIGSSGMSFRYAESVGFATEKKGWVASGVGTGMYETVDGGDTWTFVNFGRSIHGMHILNDSVGYACGRTIYKYSPDVSTSVDESDPTPISYQLRQNYPNPFNASTVISYTLPARSFVWLNIYDLEGRLVETLQRGYQDAGEYKIDWEANNLPSGIYIYSLRTDEGIFVGKALLVK